MKAEERFDYYYWYDSMALRYNDAKKVATAIESKDFDTFLSIKCQYNKGGRYFPDAIHVWDNETDEFVGELDVNIRENFDKITHSEYECG